MLKIVTPSSWQFDEPVAQLIKASSRGLRGDDLGSLIKRAGHQFADKIQSMDLDSGDVPVHLLAVGATEFYGPNRNGDGFKEACCQQFHDTFVKHARWYRNHKNKNPQKSFGLVKASHYNPEMKRIELLVTLNSTKEAAERNKGLVADEEMEKLATGGDIGVSMACRVPFDVCSGCGNKARSRNEYCDSAMCKYGGLRTKIGTVLEDGHILHADNPTPTFFDISRVFRPADRIAYVMGRMEKAAAAGDVISGAEMAEQFGLSDPNLLSITNSPDALLGQLKIAQDLSDAELCIKDVESQAAAFAPEIREATNLPDIKFVTTTKVAQLTRALSEQGIVLPVEEFLMMMHGEREKSAQVSATVRMCLPGCAARMIDDGSFVKAAQGNPYVSTEHTHMGEYRKIAANLAPDYSLFPDHVSRRLQKSALRGIIKNWSIEKSAAIVGPGSDLAKQYVLYKVASFYQMPRPTADSQLTITLSILQNCV